MQPAGAAVPNTVSQELTMMSRGCIISVKDTRSFFCTSGNIYEGYDHLAGERAACIARDGRGKGAAGGEARERRWSGADESQQQHLLDKPDLRTLAALSDSVSIVRTMRWVPLSPLLVANLAIAALLPLLPLLLLKFSVAELFEKIVRRFVGL